MGKIHCINCMKMIDEETAFCPCCGYGQKGGAVSFGLRPGTILRGRYLVGRVLGQGGFGLTYVGFDLTLEIKIAVKEYFPSDSVTRNNTVSNQVQWNTVQMDRNKWQAGCEGFLKEARRMAKLDALPGIVHVRDTFSENQTAYIIMDYIEGETLKQRLMKTGPMKYAECMEMLRPLMESLGKMHGYGLVHRDISPDNIMVQPDGSVCLLDFGAAKDISLQNAASQQIAKKGFSPPEQYREKGSIGPWTDVYALCATIYYCITGKMVPDALERMYEDTLVVNAPFLDFGDETVAQTLADGLKLRTEERIQTVEEFLARLTRPSIPPVPPEPSIPPISPDPPISPEPPIPPIPPEPPIPPKPKKKPVWIAAVAAAGLLALVLVIRAVLGLDKKETEIIQPVIGGDTAEEMPEEKKTEEAEGQKQDAVSAESIGEASADAQEEQSAYANVLMRETDLTDGGDGFWYGNVLGSEISRDSIATVTFVDTLDKMLPDTAWDVSWMQDGSVMAWTQESEVYDDLLDLFIGAEGAVKGQDCAMLFASYHNLVKIDFQSSFDTSQAISMRWMFGECRNLKELDLSGIETGNAENMDGMFYRCKGMTELDLSGFDTGNVEDMRSMFAGCTSLVSLDLSSFDTGNVKDMGSMFESCMALVSLDLSSFDTGNVESMGSMFQACTSLVSLDLSSFDTGNVESMGLMFAACNALVSLDLSSFDTGNVEVMSAMFGDCTSLVSFDLSSFDTGNVEIMESMFDGCTSLVNLDLSSFDTGNVESMMCMFRGCTSLVSLDLSSFDTGNVIDMDYMFEECKSLTALDVSNFDISGVEGKSDMFTGCGVTAEEAGLKTN